MKRCPACAEENQNEAARCRFCGEKQPLQTASLLADIAGAEITIKSLILDIPQFARTFLHLLKAPVGYFRNLAYEDRDGVRRSLAFMLQGTTLAFVILTAAGGMGQFLAGVTSFRESGPEQS